MAKKVTMQKIADHLGVSKFVVSKSLSGKGGVNETTRERVIQAASQRLFYAEKCFCPRYKTHPSGRWRGSE